MIQLLSSGHLDAKLHASIDGEPPLAAHVALIALSIDKGLVCGSGEVIDAVIEYLEDVLVANTASKFVFSFEPVPICRSYSERSHSHGNVAISGVEAQGRTAALDSELASPIADQRSE